MKYIDSLEDYDFLISSVKNKSIVVLPTFVNHEIHYIRNKPLLLFIRVLEKSVDYVVGTGHQDLFEVPADKLNELKPKEIWTINQKHIHNIFDSDNINDVSMLYYLLKNNVPEWILDTSVHLYYQRKFSSMSDINNIVPVSKHIELHQNNADKISYILGNFSPPEALLSYRWFLYNIYQLEQTGIKVNPVLLQSHYGEKIKSHISSENYVYSEYNFYTLAGRPSNRYGNINFAGLNKSDGTRKAFIPRYDNFLLFDFNSYHLNLITKFIKYKVNTNNIHTFLGQQYFGKTELTSEEYNESKDLNFKYLYGGIPKEIREVIPYFARVQDFTYVLWNEMEKNGFYKSPLTGRKIMLEHIENPNPMKVLNYFIQLMETETNMVIIDRLQKYLQGKNTKLVLYTYDSFLFDYSKEDGKKCIFGIKKILDIFPTNVYFGYNYQDLIDVTDTFTMKMK